MSNKFKLKKKLISIALALVLAAQPLASFPMNVFAGTGKNGVIMAPTVETNFDIDKIIELKAGETFNVNNYVKNIQPQGATVNYQFESLCAFNVGQLLEEDGKVKNPWIAKVKVTVGGVSKETYVIADIKGILSAATDDDTKAVAAYNGVNNHSSFAAEEAAEAASVVANASSTDAVTDVLNSYPSYANRAASALVGQGPDRVYNAWMIAAGAVYAAKTALGKGLNLESKLKTAYMAYRVAEAVWTQLNNYQENLNKCKERADAFQEVIDACWPSN